MSKILRNDDQVEAVELPDAGVSIAPNSSYTIPPQDYSTFAASSDVIQALSEGLLTLNDGGNDITNLSNAIDIIKGWPPGVAPEETDFFFDYDDIPSGAGPHSIFEHTVGVGEELYLKSISYGCRIESRLNVYKNGNLIASLRTGAALPMASFDWRPRRECVSGDILEVVLMKRANAPDTSVSVHLMGAQNTT
jgi:hypothetical protein